MGLFSSKADGSFKSVTEKLAFPCDTANTYHQKTFLTEINGVFYMKIIPPGVWRTKPSASESVLIFCHGNAATVTDHMIRQFSYYARLLNMVIYLVEYPGYGEAKDFGRPTADSCAKALATVVEHVVSEGYNHQNIYLMGHSIGTGVVARYASTCQQKLKGVILVSPYKGVINVISDSLAMTSSSANFYKTEHVLEDIHAPICFIHGTSDNVINVSHSDDMFKKIQESGDRKYTDMYFRLDGLDHNDIIYRAECWDSIVSIME